VMADPRERTMIEWQQARLLRVAFAAGAVTDAAALVSMLVPSFADLVWGFRPIERRFVAALTVVVIWGLAATEVLAVVAGTLDPWRVAPTWCLQAVLVALFAGAYHYRALHEWVDRSA